jgi:hypothetical protein
MGDMDALGPKFLSGYLRKGTQTELPNCDVDVALAPDCP